ncbi:hypothetical protein IWW38_004089, partial [Coemansia aciculifera]
MLQLCPSNEGWGPLSPDRPVDFTVCFQHGVLIAGLNLLFIAVAWLRLRALKRAPLLPSTVVAQPLFWSKMAVVAATLLASTAELLIFVHLYASWNAITISMALQTAAAAVALYLHWREQFGNPVASTTLLLFWLATTLLTAMRLRTAMSTGLVDSAPAVVTACSVFLLLSLAALVLESQPKPHMLYELDDDEDGDEYYPENLERAGRCTYQSPEERANIFSRLAFTWVMPLVEHGYKKTLQMEDMLVLGRDFRPDVVNARFQRNWQEELRSGHPSIFRATLRTYGLSLVLSGLLKMTKDLVSFLNPILLSRLIGFVSTYNTPNAEPIEYGYFYAVSMFLVTVVQNVAFQQHWVQNQRINCWLKISYRTAIYNKTMTLSNDARQKFSVGGIVTHMSVDSQRMADFTSNFMQHLWSSPLQIVLALYLLYQTLGWCAFAGVCVMVLSIPTSARLSRSMRALNKLLMGYRDQRMKIMDEVLSGVKIIKLYAWETSFLKRIDDIRVKLELGTIRDYGVVQSIFSFVVTLIPFAVSFSTFGLYSLMDNASHGPLTPQLVFVSLTLFNMLKFPLSHGPMIIPALLEAMVSSRRLLDFLTAGEIDFSAIERVSYDRDSPTATSDDVLLSVRDGEFKWLTSDDVPTLKGIDIECKRDQLVAVIGRVGAGKSSLASAILGDMIKVSGNVTVRGSLA